MSLRLLFHWHLFLFIISKIRSKSRIKIHFSFIGGWWWLFKMRGSSFLISMLLLLSKMLILMLMLLHVHLLLRMVSRLSKCLGISSLLILLLHLFILELLLVLLLLISSTSWLLLWYFFSLKDWHLNSYFLNLIRNFRFNILRMCYFSCIPLKHSIFDSCHINLLSITEVQVF